MSELIGNEDQRSFYGAFHGLFTTTMVAMGLKYLMDSDRLDEQQRFDVTGRFVDNHYRYRTGLEKLQLDKILTPKGIELYTSLDTLCGEIYKNCPLVAQYDVSNQDFVFSFEKFRHSNKTVY